MKYISKERAVLMLEDGTVFRGNAIGKKGMTGGEICFNTGMTGYQEIYTDPSYYGQVIVNTTAHIGIMAHCLKSRSLKSPRFRV
jgi:carbamoyl-phosphate synthase small subunit